MGAFRALLSGVVPALVPRLRHQPRLHNLSVFRTLLAAFLFLGTSVYASDLDAELARIMHGRSGAAVVVDVSSGHVLAAYRPEVAARRLARPGSAFKPFTLLALLQSGKLSATDSLVCRRNLHVGRHDLSCGHPQIGPLQAVSALAYSCNDFFARFGRRLSAAELQSAFVKAGFASPSGFATDEAVGFIRPARSDEERELQAVGEGDMKITPMEMLAAYRGLALRRTVPRASATEQTVFFGLEQATSYGMSRLASVPEMKVAGKTGTAGTDQVAWTNGWFAGYAPASKPEIAVVVFLERGTGTADAAPLASQIFRAWWKAKQ
jgi:cell division protein FtsI/penicillin-binding protein 2